jgi:hypothetical protein
MSRARPVLFACLISGAGLACNSDDLDALASTSGVPETTGTSTTGAPDPTTSSTTGDATTGDDTSGFITSTGDATTEAPPEQTCRDVLQCVGMCALTLDPACFQMCTENLDPEEAMKAIALGACIAQNCFASGTCSVDTLMEPPCLACIGLGILTQNPDGCEDQADACM